MKRRNLAVLVSALFLGTFACASIAQDKYGAYAGTVTVTWTEQGKLSTSKISGTVKISIPIEDKDAKRAEVGDVDKPSATLTITEWETTGKDSSPDSGGKINTFGCSLAAPTTVPANAQGALEFDHAKKTDWMAVTLVGLKPVPLNCKHSRSGAYKKTESPGLFMGTSVPGEIKELPYKDPAQIVARYKLDVSHTMKGGTGSIDQAWELKRTK